MQGRQLIYIINDPLELNLSYMPFVKDGGLFVPSQDSFMLGDRVTVELQLPAKAEFILIEGSVIWITPPNALHHVLTGIGIQFSGANAKDIKAQIEANLDKNTQVGGYTSGISNEARKP